MSMQVSEETSLHRKLESALTREYGKLYGQGARKVYCWRRYLVGLKGFRTVALEHLLANIGAFSDHVVIVDPSCALANGPGFGNRLVVAQKDFAVKCMFMGLPDIYSMRFKMPKKWSMHDHLGLELPPAEKALHGVYLP